MYALLAVIWVMKYQVGAQTETELKEKKLRVEDALNATKVRKCLCNDGHSINLRLPTTIILQCNEIDLWQP